MISVIVPARDAMPWLDDQLAALTAQTCPEAWEIVVVDNGSTDGSLQASEAWSERVERLRVVEAPAGRGAGAARNAGARTAAGRLLVFCDADDVVRPGWLEGHVRALDGADVSAGLFDFSSLNGRPPSTPVPAATAQLGFLPAGLGANLAVDRPMFERVGGFAEELLVGEDIDLCWRLQLRGARFALAPGAVVARRERRRFTAVLAQAWAFGNGAPVLYRRHRAVGARRDLRGAARSWAWLVLFAPLLATRRRTEWARTAGMRAGRLAGSARQRVVFP